MSAPENSAVATDTTDTIDSASAQASGSVQAHRILYPLGMLAARMIVHALAPRLRITGRHHVPHKGAVIFTPNHISHIDSVLMSDVVRRPLQFMAMQDMFSMPVLGPLVRLFGAFPIERDSADRAALRHAEQLLQHGQPLVVYPEGRLSVDGELGPVPGAVMLALRGKAPIIPVGISGSNHLMPYGLTCPRPTLASVRVHVGRPMDLTDLVKLPRRVQREAATQRLEQEIRRAITISRGS